MPIQLSELVRPPDQSRRHFRDTSQSLSSSPLLPFCPVKALESLHKTQSRTPQLSLALSSMAQKSRFLNVCSMCRLRVFACAISLNRTASPTESAQNPSFSLSLSLSRPVGLGMRLCVLVCLCGGSSRRRRRHSLAFIKALRTKLNHTKYFPLACCLALRCVCMCVCMKYSNQLHYGHKYTKHILYSFNSMPPNSNTHQSLCCFPLTSLIHIFNFIHTLQIVLNIAHLDKQDCRPSKLLLDNINNYYVGAMEQRQCYDVVLISSSNCLS